VTGLGEETPEPEWTGWPLWPNETRADRLIRWTVTVPRWAALAMLWVTWSWTRWAVVVPLWAVVVALILWR
jgi:hypothetical protein